MRATIRILADARRRAGTDIKKARFRGNKGFALRIAILALGTGLNVLAILWAGSPLMAWVIAVSGLISALIVLGAKKSWNRIPAAVQGGWNNPFAFPWLTAIVAIPTLMAAVVGIDMLHLVVSTTTPDDGLPWREELPAKVWWQKPPTPEMEKGLADTTETLGITYERSQSLEDGNLRVWPDSWS